MARYLFLLLALLTVPFLSAAQNACCVQTNGCTDLGSVATPPTNCLETIENTLCSQVPACQFGCCCDPQRGPGEAYKLECDSIPWQNEVPEEQRFVIPSLDQSCEQACKFSNQTITPTNYYQTQGTVFDQDSNPLEGATIFSPIPFAESISYLTNDDGSFRLKGIPENDEATLYAIHPSCKATSKTIELKSDQTGIQIFMNCAQGECTANPPEILSVSSIPNQAKNRIAWSFVDRCFDLQSFIVERCEEDFESGCVSFIANIDEGQQFIDPPTNTLNPSTTYCYTVHSLHAEGQTLSSENNAEEHCIGLGHPLCLDTHPVEFCNENRVMRCNERNELIVDEQCASDQVCSYELDINGNPTDNAICSSQPPCEKCNGPFGLFARSFRSLPILIPFGGLDTACSALDEKCYVDRTKTTIDKHYACSEVTSCYSYTSEQTCNQDPCSALSPGAQDACVWEDTFKELGKGVCKPSNARQERCDLCDEIFGSCQESSCKALGDCYFDQDPNGLNLYEHPRCLHRSEMACRFYDTKEDCVSYHPDLPKDTNGWVNASYDRGGAPKGGDHKTLKYSNDYFNKEGPREGFGYCSWIDGPGPARCVKNADNLFDQNFPEDDCIHLIGNERLFPVCLRDTTPPTTTLLLKESGIYGIDEFIDLPYYVSDNLFGEEHIDTYFCLAERGTPPCYPTTPINNFEIDESFQKSWDLYYYSRDSAGNLERIKKASLIIKDFNYPYVESVEVV